MNAAIATTVVSNNLPKKRRGRPVKEFVAQPTPVTQIVAMLGQHRALSYEQLHELTKLSEEVVGQALATLMVNSKRVRTFTRNDLRFYCLNQPHN